MNKRIEEFSRKQVVAGLRELVRKGYLKRDKKGWVDSDEVKSLLKKGKSREQIAKILERKYKKGLSGGEQK
jgi:aldehyde:ferredoxin oxidoreductase